MRIVVVVALAGLVALVVAVVTDSTYVAVGVIALAIIGMLLLLRDWRSERRHPAADDVDDVPEDVADPDMSPEKFAPDISADGRGPSSDARKD